jgi:hypothetical protein
LFCVRTTIDRLLFPSGKRVRFAWSFIIWCLVIWCLFIEFLSVSWIRKGKIVVDMRTGCLMCFLRNTTFALMKHSIREKIYIL